MTRKSFNEGWAALLNGGLANADKVTPETQELYFGMLKEIPDDIWNWGVKVCLKTLTFFPTIRDVGVACFGETRERVVKKCDPWRTFQWYEERIEAVTWQQNMDCVLAERRQIAAPGDAPALSARPKAPVERADKAEAKALLGKLYSIIDKRDQLREEQEQKAIEELEASKQKPAWEKIKKFHDEA